jgi:16S rRNA C967 or C1407 C5-methylase (RsmB/RsmF family)
VPASTVNDLRQFTAKFPDDAEALFEVGLGGCHQSIMRALVRPCEYTTFRVNTVLTSRDAVLKQLKLKLEDFNRRLKETGRPSVEPVPHPLLSDVIVLPSAQPCSEGGKLEHSSNFPEVVLDRICGEAVLRGSDAFAKGVMAASTDFKVGDKVCVTVDLDHKTTRGSKIKNHNGRRVYIGQGEVTMGRAQIFTAESGLALKMLERVCTDAPPMNNVLPGLIYVQNLPSIVVPHLLDPKPGETIIDLCAGPGGKTSHIATLMKNQGTLVAVDRSLKKAIEIRDLCVQWGVGDVVKALAMDSTQSVLMRPEALAKREALLQEQEQKDQEAEQEGGGQLEENGETKDATGAKKGGKKHKGGTKSRSTRTREKAQREARQAYEDVADIKDPLGVVQFAERRLAMIVEEQKQQEARDAAAEVAAAAEEAKAAASPPDAPPQKKQKKQKKQATKKRKHAKEKLPPVRGFHAESFDKVLLDPPCSALGLRPRLVHDCDANEMGKYAQVQENR